MIVNIVDNRHNSYNVYCSVCFEPAHHDNRVENATQHINDCGKDSHQEKDDVLLVEAIEYGNSLNGSYTMYIYDPSP